MSYLTHIHPTPATITDHARAIYDRSDDHRCYVTRRQALVLAFNDEREMRRAWKQLGMPGEFPARPVNGR